MRPEGVRQSDRVSLHLTVEGSWLNADGEAVALQLRTLLVSRNGGVVFSGLPLAPGQELVLKRTNKGEVLKTARARVVAEIDKDKDGFLYAIHILDPKADFWDIDFPAPYLGEQALGRMLMECSFCQRREVVYLNEMELKSFEVRKCIARQCKHCDAPSIWVEAVGESPAGADTNGADDTGKTERITPTRNRTRVKARLLACIRRRGFQEEVAVCEDLSRGGLSFRSRNEYPQGTRLEVAVPFTPGSGNIFVPIRVVSSRKIQAAGLYRHGAAYIRPPLET